MHGLKSADPLISIPLVPHLAPIPSAPIASAPIPTIAIHLAPIPLAPTLPASTPLAPVPSAPVPSAPIPPAPILAAAKPPGPPPCARHGKRKATCGNCREDGHNKRSCRRPVKVTEL